MTITKPDPNTIHLGGPKLVVNDYNASAAITPGMLVELHNSSGIKVRKNASATEMAAIAVALEQIEMNKTVDDDYAADDLVKMAFLGIGSTFWGLIASGQNIAPCALLQSAGDGTLKAASPTTAAGGVARFQSVEDETKNVTELTRIRVQVIS